MYVSHFQSLLPKDSYSPPTRLHVSQPFMKPDTDTAFQEVRQAFAEKATRHTRICCELCQLQSSQKGRGEALNRIGLVANTGTAHQTAERYTDPPTSECCQRQYREPRSSSFAASKQSNLLL